MLFDIYRTGGTSVVQTAASLTIFMELAAVDCEVLGLTS